MASSHCGHAPCALLRDVPRRSALRGGQAVYQCRIHALLRQALAGPRECRACGPWLSGRWWPWLATATQAVRHPHTSAVLRTSCIGDRGSPSPLSELVPDNCSPLSCVLALLECCRWAAGCERHEAPPPPQHVCRATSTLRPHPSHPAALPCHPLQRCTAPPGAHIQTRQSLLSGQVSGYPPHRQKRWLRQAIRVAQVNMILRSSCASARTQELLGKAPVTCTR